MIAFVVFLQKLARAGVGSDGEFTAITTWTHRRTHLYDGRRPRWNFELIFSFSGYRSTNGDVGEPFKWQDRKLRAGDVVTIKVINAACVDESSRRMAEDSKAVRARRNATTSI